MKTCTKCGVQKPLEGFYYRKDLKTYRKECKECILKKRKAYQKQNKIKIKQRKAEHYKINRSKILQQKKVYQSREEIKKARKDYRFKNKEIIADRWKKYYSNHKAVIKDRLKIWRKKYAPVRAKNNRKRYKEDPEYRIKILIRSACSDKRRMRSKSNTSNKLTGCTWEYLKQWIESQMTDTMAFNTIHIDHMIPLASFDLSKPE